MDANSNRVGGLVILIGSLIGLSPLFFEEQFRGQIQKLDKVDVYFIGLLIALIGAAVYNRIVAIIIMVIVLLSYLFIILMYF